MFRSRPDGEAAITANVPTCEQMRAVGHLASWVAEQNASPSAAGNKLPGVRELPVLTFEFSQRIVTPVARIDVEFKDTAFRAGRNPDVGARMLVPKLANALGIGGGDLLPVLEDRMLPGTGALML